MLILQAYLITPMHQPFCHIVPLDRYNWEHCLEVQMYPEQQAYMPSILFSLAQARFEDLVPYGVMHKGKMVGFLMYGNFAGICWINRVVIDKDHQRQGIGRAATMQLLERLQRNMRCREIRTSYAANNHIAQSFFGSLGFEPLVEGLGEEIVARYKG